MFTSYLPLTLVDVDSLSSRLGDIDAVKVGLQCEVDSDDTENKRLELPSYLGNILSNIVIHNHRLIELSGE